MRYHLFINKKLHLRHSRLHDIVTINDSSSSDHNLPFRYHQLALSHQIDLEN
jgi:hypothetical protein